MNSVQFGGFTYVRKGDLSLKNRVEIHTRFNKVPFSQVGEDQVLMTGDGSLEGRYRRFLDSRGVAHQDSDTASAHFTYVNEEAYAKHRRAIQKAFPGVSFSRVGGTVGAQESVLMTADEKLATRFHAFLAKHGISFDTAKEVTMTEY